jgi:cytochrome c556
MFNRQPEVRLARSRRAHNAQSSEWGYITETIGKMGTLPREACLRDDGRSGTLSGNRGVCFPGGSDAAKRKRSNENWRFPMDVVFRRSLSIAVAAAAVAAVASIALAQSAPPKVDPGKAQAVAKDREALMKSNSNEGKILAAVAKGQAPLDAKAVAAAEKTAANAKVLLSKFPAGTSEQEIKGGRAKPAIWTEWDKFSGFANQFQKAADELVVAAKSGDQKQFAAKQAAVAQSCGACHKPYRSPEKKK